MDEKIESKIEAIHVQEEEKKAKEFASGLSLPYVNLKIIPIDPSGFNLIPLEESKEAEIIVVQKTGKSIKIALKNPKEEKTKLILDDLKSRGYSSTIFIVSTSSLESVWGRYKVAKTEKVAITKKVEITPEKIAQLQKEIVTFKDLGQKLSTAGEMTVTEVLEIVLAGALKIEASDIHFETAEEKTRLRFRIDGILQDVTDLPSDLYKTILSRIKILSELKINVHDVPQDGRFSIAINKTEIEIRTSVIPSAYGESIVLRILNPNTISLKLEDLGLESYALEIIEKELKKPNGMIINTGPTGSGKTTTLYAFLKKVSDPKIKIITLEDPIEYHLEGIEQTQIKADKDYTFDVGLRAILRQDPDIILLGEIRDNETAGTAIHAALTGHLVFTTLHTNDTAGTIPRLVDMKVNPTLIPPALNLVIAQRLVRKVCPDCAEKYTPEDKLLASLEEELKNIPAAIRDKYPKLDKDLIILKAGPGCEKCSLLGYKGRIAVMELFTIDKEMEKIINKSPSIVEVNEVAIASGMITMRQEGIFKVLNNITSLEEIERILGN